MFVDIVEERGREGKGKMALREVRLFGEIVVHLFGRSCCVGTLHLFEILCFGPFSSKIDVYVLLLCTKELVV